MKFIDVPSVLVRNLSALALAAVGMVACSSPRELSVVKPEATSGELRSERTGRLRVFTATERHPDGDGPCFYPHSGYLVCDPAGKKVLHVANHVGSMDEVPATVSLPAGRYVVLAQATGEGRVKVPVVIEAGRSTVVHLDPPR